MSDAQSIAGKSVGSKKSAATTLGKRPKSFNTFGSSNTYSDEPWVAEYEKTPFMAKAHPKNTWVQEDAVRIIQDKIILQSQIWGTFITVAITAIFVALPKGNFY
jgi:hypothetical protein